MENIYSIFLLTKDKKSLRSSNSIPLFNTNSKKYKLIISPDIFKVQID